MSNNPEQFLEADALRDAKPIYCGWCCIGDETEHHPDCPKFKDEALTRLKPYEKLFEKEGDE